MNTRQIGLVFKPLQRDTASVNVMKLTCDRYSCIFYLILAEFAPFFHWISLNKMASAIIFQHHTVIAEGNVSRNKHWQSHQSCRHRFKYNVLQITRGSFEVFSRLNPYSNSR